MLEKGQVVRSAAGHDKDSCYVELADIASDRALRRTLRQLCSQEPEQE